VEAFGSAISPGKESIDAMLESPARNRLCRSQAEQRTESLEQILDAAEHPLSKNEFYGVIPRDGRGPGSTPRSFVITSRTSTIGSKQVSSIELVLLRL
jgi:hypothetical protein